MRVAPTKLNVVGSMRDVQLLINVYPHLLNQMINEQLEIRETIEWRSPLKDDEYAEYSDGDFLERLELQELCNKLNEFWPKKGPQWDALGRSHNKKVFLVEAKANLSELITSPSGASAESSIKKILASLDITKQYITNQTITAAWNNDYYQYANRLAHLYFLRREGVDAYLVFIYFIGDSSVDGPSSEEEWAAAKKKMLSYLDIPEVHHLSPYICDVYINVKSIGL